MNLLFFVKAVGLTIEFIMTSSSYLPINFTTNIFIHGKCLSLGNPNNGLVIITPLTFKFGLSTKSLNTVKAPKLWAYKKRGKSYLACFNNRMTSF